MRHDTCDCRSRARRHTCWCLDPVQARGSRTGAQAHTGPPSHSAKRKRDLAPRKTEVIHCGLRLDTRRRHEEPVSRLESITVLIGSFAVHPTAGDPEMEEQVKSWGWRQRSREFCDQSPVPPRVLSVSLAGGSRNDPRFEYQPMSVTKREKSSSKNQYFRRKSGATRSKYTILER